MRLPIFKWRLLTSGIGTKSLFGFLKSLKGRLRALMKFHGEPILLISSAGRKPRKEITVIPEYASRPALRRLVCPDCHSESLPASRELRFHLVGRIENTTAIGRNTRCSGVAL